MPLRLPAGRPKRALTHNPAIASAFGKAVVERRVAMGKSQMSLALDASIEKSHMGRIERGLHVPNLVAVVKIANALGCSAAELIALFEGQMRQAVVGCSTDAPG